MLVKGKVGTLTMVPLNNNLRRLLAALRRCTKQQRMFIYSDIA